MAFPATLIIKEAKISSIQTDYGYGMKSKQYYVVKTLVLLNSDWPDIELWITVNEFKEMVRNSTNQKLKNLIEEELFERNKGCIDIKEALNKCLHIKDIEVELFQIRYEDLPTEQSNLYSTKGVIELLR